MQNKKEQLGKYVRKVHEESRQFAKELLSENEKLRALAASLENENGRLNERIRGLEQELDYRHNDLARLQRQLLDVEAQNQKFSERFLEVEQQSSNLVNLYVASYRLHGTLNRDEVLAVIQEIIINMVGSEEVGIFELQPDGSLCLVSSFGLDAERYRRIPIGRGVIGQVAQSGEIYIAGYNAEANIPEERSLSACIPLKIDTKVTGTIAVFRLLRQKQGLDSLDHELFDMLATHAATALYCTRSVNGN